MMNKSEDSFKKMLKKMPIEYEKILNILKKDQINMLEEIRIKAEGKVILSGGFGEIDSGIDVSRTELIQIIEKILDHSIYAHMEDLCKGYVTVEGGHRIGICGRAVMESGNIKTIKDFSSLNIRRSREIPGCSERIIGKLTDENGDFLHTLIISPPKCGKTTLLRDIVRCLSDKKYRISLVDERSEIAAMYKGIPQHDVGKRTDVLDGGKKSEGLIMMIRAMSPEIVCTDEIGGLEDVNAVNEAVTAGIGVLTSVHGNSLEELKYSKIGYLIKERIFKRYIFMSGNPKIGTITKILDGKGENLEF